MRRKSRRAAGRSGVKSNEESGGVIQLRVLSRNNESEDGDGSEEQLGLEAVNDVPEGSDRTQDRNSEDGGGVRTEEDGNCAEKEKCFRRCNTNRA